MTSANMSAIFQARNTWRSAWWDCETSHIGIHWHG